MTMYEQVLDDCCEGLASSMAVSDLGGVRKYILELSPKSFGKLTNRQASYGEDILNQFIASGDPDYSLLSGKSELILALSLYCSRLPEDARIARYKSICDKIWSERLDLLSETVYNDLENGRAGIVLALTYLYVLCADDRIEDLISKLLLLMVSDARFHKKSITWFRSDLVQGRGELFRDNSDVIFALSYVNSVFRNEFLGILLSSILVDVRRSVRDNAGRLQQPGASSTMRRIPNSVYEGQSQELLEWVGMLEGLTNSSIQEEEGLNFNLNGLTKYDGFSTLIKNNFFEFVREISPRVLDNVISELARSCSELNQYQVLNILKATHVEKEKARFRIIFRRLKLRVEMIDKSEILTNETPVNSTFYRNCMLFASMSVDDFFNTDLTINQKGVFYRMINSNWLYSYNYEKKRFIGCFSVNRYDKSILVNTELLDGFLIRLFMYLSGRGSCVSQFKRDVLDNLNLEINEEHLKNRLLLLIRQGILIPTVENFQLIPLPMNIRYSQLRVMA
ncbi:hypothetical protein LZD49_17360 [Dyadobacter sp. CY261]|uniref:hypothetical protein n=1 Tax=Dyadobacter sp. CY261 TaxID=2907203 RepID=UPI001F3D6127|nr:hypothetical protein [Dyadobacter sp. CY261]MCF0072252.1 hypothetical protein [Dyadobacter sp. CY261]